MEQAVFTQITLVTCMTATWWLPPIEHAYFVALAACKGLFMVHPTICASPAVHARYVHAAVVFLNRVVNGFANALPPLPVSIEPASLQDPAAFPPAPGAPPSSAAAAAPTSQSIAKAACPRLALWTELQCIAGARDRDWCCPSDECCPWLSEQALGCAQSKAECRAWLSWLELALAGGVLLFLFSAENQAGRRAGGRDAAAHRAAAPAWVWYMAQAVLYAALWAVCARVHGVESVVA
ncbi:hypothetical protein H632_c4192p0 [Helicosporidium sp. ATCC 50920]|nr:hypothetical protein H632_c4192p0 [Helicosporidium sp. ATCC 50920]|eukprot:KDD71908.1 hypothetical protein H632_c4192p0 [Helicosporidium sp. ATCC 50920]